MAKKRTKPVPLPDPGDVFLMPLGDGRFGVCRVLRANTEEERKGHGAPYVLVAASPWVGTDAPDLTDARVRRVQRLTHHNWKNWKNPLNIHWVSDPPPAEFRRLGVITPSAADGRRESPASGGWSFGIQVLMQWRWDYEREAVLREDAESAEREAREREAEARRPREAPVVPTLGELRTKRRFPGWKDFAPDKATPAARKIFHDTVDALIALGDTPAEPAALAVLQRCIERLNALDDKHGGFIETTIREELCEEFDELVQACGLGAHEDLSGRWREW